MPAKPAPHLLPCGLVPHRPRTCAKWGPQILRTNRSLDPVLVCYLMGNLDAARSCPVRWCELSQPTTQMTTRLGPRGVGSTTRTRPRLLDRLQMEPVTSRLAGGERLNEENTIGALRWPRG